MTDNYLAISSLQHYAYCPRQFALIHIEQVWDENRFTAEGRILHERVDTHEIEQRGKTRYERSVLIRSEQYRIQGKMDLLEIHGKRDKQYFPVEYKRGKPKVEHWDRLQLCAQALCIEEMRDTTVNEGAIWYWEVRKREPVLIDHALRSETISIRNCKITNDVDKTRGLEGEAAANYFGVFNALIRSDEFTFNGRVRRPPTDPVNALLSFSYSLITQECVSALAGVGLDPYVGFLHKDRPGRPGLALDLLEEFRSYWSERFVLTLINRKQFRLKDFVSEGSGAVRLTDEARKQFLIVHQERKQKEVFHPYLKEQVPIGLLPHCQAMLLARHIRGDTKYYTPFLVK